MKRSPMKPGKPLERKTPLRSNSTLKASKPMARGTTRMRASKPASEKTKRVARNAGPDWLAMCRGQRCYLLLPGVRCSGIDTVVPCHSNQGKHGKGMGIKALDIYTVPGCCNCHRELDQGSRFTKDEKASLWDLAYNLWEIDRKNQFRTECSDNVFPELKI